MMPPRSHWRCQGSAGWRRSFLTGVVRFFKDGGNHRYRLFVPLSLEIQINDGLLGYKPIKKWTKNRKYPLYTDQA